MTLQHPVQEWFIVADSNLLSLKGNSVYLAQDLQAQHLPHEMKEVNGHKSGETQVKFLFSAIKLSYESAGDPRDLMWEGAQCDY